MHIHAVNLCSRSDLLGGSTSPFLKRSCFVLESTRFSSRANTTTQSGAVLHRGAVRPSHPAVTGSILGVPRKVLEINRQTVLRVWMLE